MSRPAHQAPEPTPEQRTAQHLAVVARRFAAGRASAVELDEAVHLWLRLRGAPPLPPGQPVQPPRVGPGESHLARLAKEREVFVFPYCGEGDEGGEG